MKTITIGKRCALLAVLVVTSSATLNAQVDSSPARQTDRATDTTIRTTNQTQVTKINKGSTFIGATVKNQQGEDLGKVHDIVIDFSSDKVSYVVLGNRPGVLSAQKFHAVPLRAFQPDAEGTGLILNADKTRLESSAGFDKDNWPGVGSSTWGAEPFWKDNQGANGLRPRRDLEQPIRENKDGVKDPYRTSPQSQPRP
jgi:sporulation protein YlmC with PRC-barrel domain